MFSKLSGISLSEISTSHFRRSGIKVIKIVKSQGSVDPFNPLSRRACVVCCAMYELVSCKLEFSVPFQHKYGYIRDERSQFIEDTVEPSVFLPGIISLIIMCIGII